MCDRLDPVPQIRPRLLVVAALTRPDRGDDEPVRHIDRIRRRIEDSLGAEHDLALRLCRGRAELLLVRGAGPAEVEALTDLLATRDRLSGSADLEKALVRRDLALAHQQCGDAGTARRLLDQTLGELAGLLGREHPRVLVLRAELAWLNRAVPQLRAVLAAQLLRRGAHHPEVAATRHLLALVSPAESARTQLRLAVGIRTRRLGTDHPLTRASVAALAEGR
jgi:hypothetical protein